LICAVCAEVLDDADLFCEACGAPVGGLTAAPAASAAGPEVVADPAVDAGPGVVAPGVVEPGASPGGGDNCEACGEGFDADGFCQNCGRRRPEPHDHEETDLGLAAAVTDRGLRHRSNEDAYALAVRGDHVAAVVCDGVSTSRNAQQVSHLAAQAAIAVLERHLDEPERWEAAAGDAVAAAQRAAATLGDDTPTGGYLSAPATTIVLGLVGPGRVVVANVGDSRAYLMNGSGGETVSADDSLAAEAVLEGVPPDIAYNAPGAHQITAWLGKDAASVTAHVARFDPSSDAVLLVCSDGVWNYAESPEQLATAAAPLDAASPLDVARRLVDFGLAAGGADNLTAAVIPVRPAGPTEVPREEHLPDARL
jgi:serine/threonine protein phosphatase PrpC